MKKRTITIEAKTGFIINGRTCDMNDACNRDFYEGVFDTIEEARAAKLRHLRIGTCASKRSHRGDYCIYEIDYEQLSDGRIIIGSKVWPSKNFREPSSYRNININYQREFF